MLRKSTSLIAILTVACLLVGGAWAQSLAPMPEGDQALVPPPVSVEKSPAAAVAPARAETPTPAAMLIVRPTEDTPAEQSPRTVAGDVALNSQVPALQVSTAGPDTIVVGEPATYVVRLYNRGDVEARAIVVHVALPTSVELRDGKKTNGSVERQNFRSGVSRLVWTIDAVAAKGEEALSLIVVPRDGDGFDLSVDWSVKQTSSTTKITVKEPRLAVDLEGPTDIVYGKTPAWTIGLSNPGTCDAEKVNVDVYLNKTKVGSAEVGRLAAGAERMVDLKLAPTAAGVGQLEVVATADRGLRTNAAEQFVVRRARLQVAMVGPVFQYAGSDSVYQVRLVNTGDAPAEKVVLKMDLPNGTRYVSGLEEPKVTEDAVSWSVAELAEGKEQIYQVVCEPRQGGHQKFAVVVESADKLQASDAVVTQVKAVADLKLDVVDPKGATPVGKDTVYEIHVTNRGTDVARNVYIVAICSPEVEPTDVTGSAAIETGQIFFSPVKVLESEQKVIHKVTVRAHKPGAHLFRVIVKCADPDTRLASEETTRFFDRPATLRTATVPKK